ncbi:UNVERIFIED_CONTAM: hypothetical protein FKN15_075815 [Acipenser sinensis]
MEEQTRRMERQTQELLRQKWEPPLPEPRGEEGKSIPPLQPRPPPLQSSSALLRSVPQPLLLDTLPVFLDLPVLDLEPRSLQHWPQLCPWFPASLSPEHPDVAGLLPDVAIAPPVRCFAPPGLSDITAPVPRARPVSTAASFSSSAYASVGPVSPVGSHVAGLRSLPGSAGRTNPSSSPPVEEGGNGHCWT